MSRVCRANMTSLVVTVTERNVLLCKSNGSIADIKFCKTPCVSSILLPQFNLNVPSATCFQPNVKTIKWFLCFVILAPIHATKALIFTCITAA